MNNITRRTTIVLTATIGIFLCIGLGTVMFKGFIDFPCFVRYDEVNQCVLSDGYLVGEEDEERIQVYLDTSQIGFSGMGCNMEESNDDVLGMETSVLSLKFERSGDRLLVNGKELAAGDDFSFTKFWNLNPWTVYTINFTNYGAIPVCQSNAPSRIVVMGEYGNELSIIKGIIVLTILLIITFKLSRSSKTDTNAS